MEWFHPTSTFWMASAKDGLEQPTHHTTVDSSWTSVKEGMKLLSEFQMKSILWEQISKISMADNYKYIRMFTERKEWDGNDVLKPLRHPIYRPSWKDNLLIPLDLTLQENTNVRLTISPCETKHRGHAWQSFKTKQCITEVIHQFLWDKLVQLAY